MRRTPAAAKDAFAIVRKIGLTLPRAVESASYGSPDLRVDGTMFACMASHRSAEPGSLVVRMAIDDRDALIAADPDTYYVTDHYVGYASVLVRLSRVHPDALQDLLKGAYNFVLRGRTRHAARRKTPRRASP